MISSVLKMRRVIKRTTRKALDQTRPRYQNWRHRLRMLRRCPDASRRDYRAYLDAQLARTLQFKNGRLRPGARILIDELTKHVRDPTGSSVLCIGCRHAQEIDYLEGKGFRDVRGIDLFSEDPRILVMDMHDMRFDQEHFDVIFASHSLEHAWDIERVLREIDRIASNEAALGVEVPISYATSSTDLVDFGCAEKLGQAFARYGFRPVWSEEAAAHSERNHNGTSIARIVFLRN